MHRCRYILLIVVSSFFEALQCTGKAFTQTASKDAAFTLSLSVLVMGSKCFRPFLVILMLYRSALHHSVR